MGRLMAALLFGEIYACKSLNIKHNTSLYSFSSHEALACDLARKRRLATPSENRCLHH